EQPDLVVLDLMLPGMDGLEVCRRLQSRRWVPVLMLTARTEEADKVAGFAVGADDYLTKPFSLRELTVPVPAILPRVDRLAATPPRDRIELAGLSIDPSRRKVTMDGEEVQLTPLEFEILLAMARDPGVVFTREQLMDRVWGYRDYAGGRVVDSHVARIRRKLGEDGAEPRYVRTVHGVGYAFADEGACDDPAAAGADDPGQARLGDRVRRRPHGRARVLPVGAGARHVVAQRRPGRAPAVGPAAEPERHADRRWPDLVPVGRGRAGDVAGA